jgi:hypothetical protein
VHGKSAVWFSTVLGHRKPPATSTSQNAVN